MWREDEVIDKTKIKNSRQKGGFFCYMEELAKLLIVIFLLVIVFVFE